MSMSRYMAFVVLLALSAGTGLATAAEPCGAVICLSTNKTAPHQCKEAVDGYFSIRVYEGKKSKVFSPSRTAVKRLEKVLDKCPDARDEDRDYVTATYGSLEHSPFDYTDVNEDSGENDGYSADSKEIATERRYLSCAKAATMPDLASKVRKDYGFGTGVDGPIYDGNGEVVAIVEGGMANLYLGTSGGEIVDGSTTPVKREYGFAVQERTVERTTGQHKIITAGEWRTVSTGNCSVSAYYAQFQQAGN